MSQERITFAHHRLISCLHKYGDEDWVKSEFARMTIRQFVRVATPFEAKRLRLLIKAKHKTHSHVASAVVQMLHTYRYATMVDQYFTHFDLSYKLCGDSPAYTLSLIRQGLSYRPEGGLNTDQEGALIALEASRWESMGPDSSGTAAKPLPEYEDCVKEVVVKRPNEVQAIIALAQENQWQRAEQLEAVLDGSTIPALSEGAL